MFHDHTYIEFDTYLPPIIYFILHSLQYTLLSLTIHPHFIRIFSASFLLHCKFLDPISFEAQFPHKSQQVS